MDILLLAPIGMFVVMGLLAAIGLPGKPRDRSPAPASAPSRPAAPQQSQRVVYGQPQYQAQPSASLPPPPPGWRYQFAPDGRPSLVPAGGR